MPVRYLDEAPAASTRTTAPAAGKSAIESIKENPVARFLGGAGKTIAETGPIPLARALAGFGVPGANKVVEGYEKSNEGSDLGTAGRLGGMGGDLLANAAVTAATGGAGLVVPALQMAAGHGLQDYANTGEVSPGKIALDAGTGIGLGAVGGKIGPWLKKMGFGATRRGLGIPAKMMKGANPIDLEYALKEKLVPFRGGASKVEENAGVLVDAADKQSDDALDRLGVLFSAPDAAASARKGISSRVESGGSRGLLPSQEESALSWVDDYVLQAERMAKKAGVHSEPWDGYIPATLGKDLRATAQGNAKYVSGKTPQGLDLASEEFARAANTQMDDAVNRMGNQSLKSYRQGDKSSVGAYNTAREESRKLTPLRIAAEDEAAKSRRLGLVADITMGAFGSGAAFANPYSLIPTALAIGGRNLFMTPGGGRMLYETGRGASADATRKAGRYGLDLARSAAFSPNQGN